MSCSTSSYTQLSIDLPEPSAFRGNDNADQSLVVLSDARRTVPKTPKHSRQDPHRQPLISTPVQALKPKRRGIEKRRRPDRQSTEILVTSNSKSSRVSQRTDPGLSEQQNPERVTIAVCQLWLIKYPGIMPSEHTMSCLSHAFW